MPNTLLLVEDDPDSADALEAFLSLEGYQVRWARNGREALHAVNQPDDGGPAVILMDLTLPDIPGTELGLRIRQLSQAPIVILSARPPDAIRDAASAVGALAVLRKPFDLDALRSLIELALHQPT
jgi:DNA-binding response OmpR family regulator